MASGAVWTVIRRSLLALFWHMLQVAMNFWCVAWL